ncbi:MAG TPA: hypothetical protein VM900_06475 [Sphingomonas sp.]|nr:hypothetical protein [Sphingomonas sp.]
MADDRAGVRLGRMRTPMSRVQPVRSDTSRSRYLVRGEIAPVFVERNALAAEDAIAFGPRSRSGMRQFVAMVRAGSIREPRPGLFYLDYARYEAAAAERSRRMIPWLAGGAMVIAAVATRFYTGG